jgi:L-histidine N-alpha-methyltransferase
MSAGLRDPGLMEAIRRGFAATPKRLPVECFYDDLGSALFEAITLLPEYGLSRAGRRLFERHAGEMGALLARPVDVVELGSGSGRKTRILLEELAAASPVHYLPVDVSPAALEDCAREIGRLKGVTVLLFEGTYLDGMERAAAARRDGASMLVLFLGSNIGNLDRTGARSFLARIRSILRRGDGLLVAADLDKREDALLAAYDDPLGLTAAFNLNALGRINRELGGRFDLTHFAHKALYDRSERRVEMHLVSARDQEVAVEALQLEVTFRKGETLWTESSYKFARGEIAAMGEAVGFRCAAEWVDEEWPFSQTFLLAR